MRDVGMAFERAEAVVITSEYPVALPGCAVQVGGYLAYRSAARLTMLLADAAGVLQPERVETVRCKVREYACGQRPVPGRNTAS